MEHLYVAQGQGGLLKIGKSANPKLRKYSLAKEFKKRGDKLVRMVPCEAVNSAFGIEWTLQRLTAERHPRQSGREWFVGGDFDIALGVAQALTTKQALKEAYEASPKGIAAAAKLDAEMAQRRAEHQEYRAAAEAWRAAHKAAAAQRAAFRKRRKYGPMALIVAVLAPELADAPAKAGA